MKILALGDIVGKSGVDALCATLWETRRENGIDFVTANCENAAEGNGVDKASAERLLASGCDVLTSGNHVWKRNDIYSFLDDSPYIVRPMNYPSDAPGKGWTVVDARGIRVLVMNVQGTVYMESLDDPFRAVERTLEREKGGYDVAVLDVHAEATSEKAALARCFDGKITFVFGTHTHVQTADERILPNGSAFITDLGMCGPDDSILGVKSDNVIRKLRSKLPVRFESAPGKVTLHGAVVTLGHKGGVYSVEKIERFVK